MPKIVALLRVRLKIREILLGVIRQRPTRLRDIFLIFQFDLSSFFPFGFLLSLFICVKDAVSAPYPELGAEDYCTKNILRNSIICGVSEARKTSSTSDTY